VNNYASLRDKHDALLAFPALAHLVKDKKAPFWIDNRGLFSEAPARAFCDAFFKCGILSEIDPTKPTGDQPSQQEQELTKKAIESVESLAKAGLFGQKSSSSFKEKVTLDVREEFYQAIEKLCSAAKSRNPSDVKNAFLFAGRTKQGGGPHSDERSLLRATMLLVFPNKQTQAAGRQLLESVSMLQMEPSK
jgi:hypothetical protein